MNSAHPLWSRRVRLTGAFLLAVMTFPPSAHSQVDPRVTELAQQALKTYVTQFITDKNASRFGFRNAAEGASARLGAPLHVAFIGLSDLQHYQAGTAARRMVKDAGAVWFPVLIGEQVRAKLEMVQRDGRWSAGEFGGVRTAPAIADAQRRLPEQLAAMKISAGLPTIVKVPALNTALLLVESPSGEYLVPAAAGVQKYGLEQFRVYASGEVLTILSEFSRKIDPKKVM